MFSPIKQITTPKNCVSQSASQFAQIDGHSVCRSIRKSCLVSEVEMSITSPEIVDEAYQSIPSFHKLTHITLTAFLYMPM